MKKITYKVFKGEQSKNYSFELPQEVFEFLDSPVMGGISREFLPLSIVREINDLQDKYFNIHYDIIYWVLENRLGIGSTDIEDLTVENYGVDEIMVHVYLDMR